MRYAFYSILLALFFSLNVSAAELTDDLTFDSDGVIVDANSELTFNLPDITAGSIYDIRNNNLSPHISVEIIEYKKIVSD